METSRPENGLVLEKMAVTKLHGMSEGRGKAHYGGSETDAVEFHVASLPAKDHQNFESTEAASYCFSQAETESDVSTRDSLVAETQGCSRIEHCEEADQYSSAVTDAKAQKMEHVLLPNSRDMENGDSGEGSCRSVSQDILPKEDKKSEIGVSSFHELTAKVAESVKDDELLKVAESARDDRSLKVAEDDLLKLEKAGLGDELVHPLHTVSSDVCSSACVADGSSSLVLHSESKQAESIQDSEIHEVPESSCVTQQENIHCENKDEKLNSEFSDLQPHLFEDITEDEEDSESEVILEKIELQPDDFTETADFSRTSREHDKDTSDTSLIRDYSMIKPEDRSSKCSELTKPDVDNELVVSETSGYCSKSNSQTIKTPAKNADVASTDGEEKRSSLSLSQYFCQDKAIAKQVEQGDMEAVSSSLVNNHHMQKPRTTARKTGRPVAQTDCSTLKTINLHPIKNITMKLSEIEAALDCDPFRDKASKIPKISDIAAAFNSENVASKTTLTSQKKKRRNKDDMPGTKKIKKLKLAGSEIHGSSLDVSESHISANDSFKCHGSLVDIQDSANKNVISQTNAFSLSVDSNPDYNVERSLPSPATKQRPSNVPPSMPSPSSSAAAVTSLTISPSPSRASTSLVKSPPGKKNGKMKTVLDMLHARNRQKAEQDERSHNISQTVSITSSETSTTTTILVSPPPNKPIVEGVKRKGTPRKRRAIDVICLSDSEDSGQTKRVNMEGKRRYFTGKKTAKAQTMLTSTPSPQLQLPQQLMLQNPTPSSTQAPMVMFVAQNPSQAPALRSLLPRHSFMPQADPSTGRTMQQPSPRAKLGSLPFISTLPVGAKTINLASLPPGIAAVPNVPLCPGTQSLVTFFTTVPTTAVSIPISGAAPVASSKQFTNSFSHGKTKTTSTSSSGSQLLTLPTTKLPSAHNGSDSLRGLLLGKPYAFTRVTPSAASPQLSATPMLFQMITTSGTNLVPVAAQPPTLMPAAVLPPMLKSSSSSSSSSLSSSASSSSSSFSAPVNKSTYSLLKHHASGAPNGISCLTPPKTPDSIGCSEAAASATLGHSLADQSLDSEVIPLCCCRINGASFNKLSSGVTYCQALDTVDNKVLGCCNKVTNPQLVRPGVKIPFMAVCETHRKRLKLHQSCPGCGHFCTQGKFQQCRKEGKSSVHNFHKQCVFYRGGKTYCPHCGEEAGQCEVELRIDEKPDEMRATSSLRLAKTETEKKVSRGSNKNLVKNRSTNEPKTKNAALSNSKAINQEALILGPDQQALSRLFKCATEDRPKKYRTLVKDLYIPASEGDIEKVFYLLVDGTDPNTRFKDYEDQTPLHVASTSGSIGTVYILKQFGAEIHAQDRTLRTPLMCAAENGHLKVVQFLIKAGAKVEDRGEDGMTSLHYAAKAGYVDIIHHILDTGKLNVNIQDDGGWTPIIWATESQLPAVVRYLLAHGGDPNKKDNEENTGLHWAAFSGSLEIAEMFLDIGCEIDAINEHGDRPLHIAARQDHYDIVVLLLARGASVDTKNNKDETPLDSCINKSGQVWMALKVNQQLRSFATQKLIHPERLLERDITMGREKLPIACVNSEDMEHYPTDFLYVNENVITSSININYVITSLRSCRCLEDCSSVSCGCSRSSATKRCYSKNGRLLDEIDLQDPPVVFECNRACQCHTNCYNRVVQNGITCRLQMFRTADRGWGVRTLMDIHRGTFVCEYVGELISDADAEKREDDSYIFDLDNKDSDLYCLDARMYGNISRFINHQCEPNLTPVKVFAEHQDLRFPRMCLFSCRDIKAYEELGFDYGDRFWFIKHKSFTCSCGSSNCRYSAERVEQTLSDFKMQHSLPAQVV